jgi:hypothetical protein
LNDRPARGRPVENDEVENRGSGAVGLELFLQFHQSG